MKTICSFVCFELLQKLKQLNIIFLILYLQQKYIFEQSQTHINWSKQTCHIHMYSTSPFPILNNFLMKKYCEKMLHIVLCKTVLSFFYMCFFIFAPFTPKTIVMRLRSLLDFSITSSPRANSRGRITVVTLVLGLHLERHFGCTISLGIKNLLVIPSPIISLILQQDETILRLK